MSEWPWPAELRPFADEPFASAVVTGKAREPMRCARMRNHRIGLGEWVGFVPGVGWCCDVCAT